MKRAIKDLIYSYIPTNYLDLKVGNTNLILTAPHGGGAKPVFIPNRKYGKTSMDTYTRRFTRKLLEYYPEWEKPYYIISEIHRKKVDFNRDIEEGAQGNKRAIKLWNLWNNTLISFYNNAKVSYNKALYVDIHSHNNSEEFHLGYNLSKSSYLNLMQGDKITGHSSLYGLRYDEFDMLFGPSSFKSSIEQLGYRVYTPKEDEIFFNGGRNIEVYSGDGVGAIQIELPVKLLEKEFGRICYTIRFAIETFRKKFTYA